ncbi:HAMP domain-containing sensor histidine kinase [Catellatospora tritici]|uniref:HAMP domain-containing sensor histidine kinase n=1 Tax=Catellatospora tritici TaxID=2851566 RepID=UPI001C2CE8D6|nr:HAMP domain-containing sensor histidine kinase [Catellatospora tritici]MBV1854409.1 HAMP domain-containing histidine kinase [Catellatospora tritici]
MTGRPSLSNRLTLIAAAAVTAVAVAVGVLALLALHQTLISQADRELRAISHGPLSDLTPAAAADIPPSPLDAQQDLRMQIRFPTATITVPRGTTALPWTAADDAVATGTRTQAAYTAATDEGRFRVLTFRSPHGQTIQLARSLTSADATIARFGTLIAALVIAAAAAAAFAGRFVARAGLRPVGQLTAAATRIAETRDLSNPLPAEGHDEIAQLGHAFNHVLTRLADARQQQRDLIEDAAHELRTPMASMRTNVEVLIRDGNRLDEADRAALLEDLELQSVELAALVANLVDLARSRTADEPMTAVELNELAASAIGLAEAHFPQTRFLLHAGKPITALARPTILQRALVNLLDNAAKFGRDDQTVELRLTTVTEPVPTACLSVLDRNPTIPADQRERVFQRFHRLDASRAVAGSGLGLAIVQQAAAAHNGTVIVTSRPGGGNEFRMTLPLDAATDQL